MTRSTGLIAYAILSTAGAFVCAVGWWRAAEPEDEAVRSRAPRPPAVRPVPPGHRPRTVTTGPESSRSTAAPTEVGATGRAGAMNPGRNLSPPSNGEASATGNRCPKCGEPIPGTGSIHVTGTVIAPGNGVQVITHIEGVASLPGVAQRLADLPGATIRDKLRALVDQIHAAIPIPKPDDPSAQYPWQEIQQAQSLLEAVFEEAQRQDPVATREALFGLLRTTDDTEYVSSIGGFLARMNFTEAEKDEFDRFLLELGNSPRVADRLKAVGEAPRSESPAMETWWMRMLQNDIDPAVRSAAAGSPPPTRTDAVRNALLRAAQFDPAPNVRVSAIGALGSNPTEQELRTLLGLMRSDRETEVQQAVLDATAWNASIRDTEIRDALLEVARDATRDQSLRSNAVSALLWGTNGGDGFIQDPAQRRELEVLENRIYEEPEPEGE